METTPPQDMIKQEGWLWVTPSGFLFQISYITFYFHFIRYSSFFCGQIISFFPFAICFNSRSSLCQIVGILRKGNEVPPGLLPTDDTRSASRTDVIFLILLNEQLLIKCPPVPHDCIVCLPFGSRACNVRASYRNYTQAEKGKAEMVIQPLGHQWA